MIALLLEDKYCPKMFMLIPISVTVSYILWSLPEKFKTFC